MKRNRLAIFDKDGTLVTPASGEQFVQSPRDQKIIPGMDGIVHKLYGNGYKIVIASNQGGVPAYKSQDFAMEEMQYLLELFPEIQKIYFAPGQGRRCISVEERLYGGLYSESFALPWMDSYRKPAPGMLASAFWEFKAHPGDCFFIGDKQSDYDCAINAGCGFWWLSQIQNEFLRSQIA